MKTIGIFGDRPNASTGFAVVLSNLANELSRKFRVIYFGRFGQDTEFAPDTTLLPEHLFEYVPCQGGVWDEQLVVRILKHYPEIDYIFTEDDWFSVRGLLNAAHFWDKPVHLHTPIDSLPIHENAWYNIFTHCDKIYIPNSSYQIFNGRKRAPTTDPGLVDRLGETFKAVYLPHGIDTNVFRPFPIERNTEFTFLWTGRIEQRKAPARAILAFEKIASKCDARLLIRSDWNTPQADRFLNYIIKKNLPVDLEQMAIGDDMPHNEMAQLYNKADVNICTAMAGGFEMGITEAAACGMPSICTDWTFMNENVVHGKSGWLVPVEGYTYPTMAGHAIGAKDRIWGQISIDDLADTMYYAYMNQPETRSMGVWAREYVKYKYNWRDIGNRLAEEILE